MRIKHFPTQLKNRLPLLKLKIVPEFYPDSSDDLSKPVPREIQQGLITAFQQLMSQPSSDGLDYPFSGLGNVAGWYKDIENCKAKPPAEIHYIISKKEFVTSLPFVASLTVSKLKLPAHQKHKYECYHRLIFISCMLLWILDDHKSAIISALREWRLTAEETERHSILEVLPDPLAYDDIASLRADLDILSKMPGSTTPSEEGTLAGFNENNEEKHFPSKSIRKEIRARIRAIYIVLNDALKRSDGKTFTRASTVLRDSTEKVSICSEPLPTLDDSGDQLTQIHIRPLIHPDEADWLNEETQASQPDIAIYQYAPKQQFTKDRRLRALQGKRVCEQLAMRNLSLPCQFEQLSDWDIHHLNHQLVADLVSSEPHNRAIAATLLCSLLFGQQIQSLVKMSENKPQQWIQLKQGQDGGSHLVVHCKHVIPGNNPSLDMELQLPESRQDFYLPLSDHLLNWFQNKPQWHTDEQDLKKYLQNINEKQICRLSLGRIARYLTHWGMNHGIDTLYLAIIRAEPIHKHPSLSYAQWLISELLDIWYQYIEAIFAGQPVTAALPVRKSFEQLLGSRLYLPDTYLSGLFHLQKKLLQAIPSSSTSQFIEYHNRYIAYIWLLLSVATGHRPVNAPFGFCTDGSIVSGHWWISDKERRAGLAARTLVLPETAQKQITLYLAHLRTLQQYFKVLDPQLTKYLQHVQEGKQNLFFFIDNVAKTDELPSHYLPLDITPTRLKEQFGKSMPYPMNWHRHHNRSYLMKTRINPQIIDCWMGHEELGAEGLGSFSCLSLKDYQQISLELEQLFLQNQIGALAGCQIH